MRLPSDWHQLEIAEVAAVNERSLANSTSPDYHFWYIDLSSVTKGKITVPTISTVFGESPSRARRILKKGDVLLSMVRPNLQGYGRVSGDCADLIASTGFAVLSAKTVDSAFLYHSLFGDKIVAQLNRLLVGSNYPAINASDVEDLVIALPRKIEEQRKIADILTTWDEALEKLDSLIEAKDRHRKALMQQLLTGRKRFPAFAHKAWKKIRLNELMERVFRPIEWTADMPLSLVSLRRRCGGLFRRPDMLGSDYKTQDLHSLKAGDFLISKRQVAHGAWGHVTPEFAGCQVSKEYAILVNSAPDKLHMPFFAWLAQTPRLIRLARVASTGVHIEKLIFDPAVFLRESIRIPPTLEEQQKIANILDTAQAELTLLRTQRNALDQQKRALMQRLLTGRLRVKPSA